MSGFRDFLRAMSLLLGDMAFAGLLYGLYPIGAGGVTITLPFLFWAGLLAVQMTGSLLFLWRGVPAVWYVLFSLAAVVLTAVLTAPRAFSSAPEVSAYGLTAFLAGLTAVHGALLAAFPAGANWNLRYADCLVLSVAAFLALFALAEREPQADCLLLSGAALFLNLFSVTQIRTGTEEGTVIRGAGAGGRLALLCLALLVFLAAAVIGGVASGQVHSLTDALLAVLSAVWRVLEIGLTAFATVIGYLILFFAWLCPATHGAVNEKVSMAAQEMSVELGGTGSGIPFWAVVGIGVGLMLAGLIFFLWQCRGIRLGTRRRRGARLKAVRKSRLREALLALAGRIGGALRFEWEYRRNYNTAAGLLVFAERCGRKRRLPRQRKETGREYLLRLAGCGGGADLEELAALLELRFYAGSEKEPERELCRRVRRGLREGLSAPPAPEKKNEAAG